MLLITAGVKLRVDFEGDSGFDAKILDYVGACLVIL